MSALMRNASFPVPVIVAPARFHTVMLRGVVEPDVSMPRVVPVIVPELSMVTPGAGEALDPLTVQVIAVPLETVPPAAIVQVSVLTTVCAPTVWPLLTVKDAAEAGSGAVKELAHTSIAMRLTPHFQRDMICRPQCRLNFTDPGLVEGRNDSWMT